MKNTIFFTIPIIVLVSTLVLICHSCNQVTKQTKAPPKVNYDNSVIDTSCFSSYKIYSETAYIWQASWVTYYNNYRGGNYNNSPKLNFDKDNLGLMYKEVKDKDAPGILLYYILINSTDSFPSLAMRNTSSCLIDNESPILMSPWDGGEVSTITLSEFELYKTRWRNHSFVNSNVYTVVNGYNYSWQSIKEAMAADSTRSGIFINYGLRTLEPDEAGYFSLQDSTITGSVVYCNILYNSEDESNSNTLLLDFAMPCPAFCGLVEQ